MVNRLHCFWFWTDSHFIVGAICFSSLSWLRLAAACGDAQKVLYLILRREGWDEGKEGKVGQEEEKMVDVVDNMNSLITANLCLKEWLLTRGGSRPPTRLPH